MEAGSCSVLISLDISAAFDTIDIDLLLQRLESDFGIVGMASAWLRSYLIGRACYVAIGDCKSDVWTCNCPSLWPSGIDRLPLGTEQVVSSIPGSVGYISHVH